MRPLRLVLEGFSGFRTRTEVDFSDVELAAFVGPTGSGKSSIIDGITFALYGSVPRYGDDRLVAPVIHQLSQEARAFLDFEVMDRRYTVARVVVRTRTGATTREARLEEGESVLASGPKEVTAEVSSLLGLTFEQFTKTVVLPQGKFADFLHDQPGNRQALLRKLLDLEVYSRMGAAARQRANDAQSRTELLAGELERSADLTETELAAVDERATEIDEARKAAKELHREHATVVAALHEVSSQAKTLDDAIGSLARIEVPDGVADLDSHIDAAGAALASAVSAQQAAVEAQERAQHDVDEGPEAAESQRLLDAHRRVEQLEAELPPLAEAATVHRARADEAAATLRAAREAEAEARAELDRARDQAGLAGVVARLRVGDACPVCQQEVRSLPDHDPDEELKAASDRHDAAVAARAKAEKTADAASKEATRSEAALTHKDEELERQRSALVGAPPVDALERQIEEAQRLQVALKQAASAVREAHEEHRRASKRVEDLRGRGDAARAGLGRARDSVSSLSPPEPGGRSLLEDWQHLVDWAEAHSTELTQQRARLAEKADDLAARLKDLAASAVTLCAPFDVDPELDGLTERLATAAERSRSEAARYRERLEERARLERQKTELAERESVSRELANLLSAKQFERWLLVEAMEDLGERASERLVELSGGQYSLQAEEDRFTVRDRHNGDDVRDVRTLSGGETFLTSLSLALALAEGIRDMSSEDSPALGSVFLDEGFGTLDPEALDVVAGAIEDLGASGRMVGIVTHIRELAERMPVRFEVHKDSDGSHVERVEV